MIAATLAQLADLVTAHPSTEVHPIGVMLVGSPYAVPAKLALLAVVMAVVSIIEMRRPRLAAMVLIACTLGGVIGAISNVIA